MIDAGDAWVACRVVVIEHLRRFRQALAKVGKRTRAIALMEKPKSPGWWPVNDACLALEDVQSKFLQAGTRHPGRLGALTDLEVETVALAGNLLHRGLKETDLISTFSDDADPGVALGNKMHAMGMVNVRGVGLRNRRDWQSR